MIGNADFPWYSLKVDPPGVPKLMLLFGTKIEVVGPLRLEPQGHLIKRKLPLQKKAEFTDGWLFVVGSLVGTPCDDFVLLLFLTIK